MKSTTHARFVAVGRDPLPTVDKHPTWGRDLYGDRVAAELRGEIPFVDCECGSRLSLSAGESPPCRLNHHRRMAPKKHPKLPA